MKKISQEHFNTFQLKMPLEISKIIVISDPVYDCITKMLRSYFAAGRLISVQSGRRVRIYNQEELRPDEASADERGAPRFSAEK